MFIYYVIVFGLILLIDKIIASEHLCGIPAITPRVGARIVGGEKARPHSWPWQVSLQTSGGQRFCGGSIIDRMWVLSAAHCQPDEEWGTIFVVAGQHSPDDELTEFQQRIPVETMIVHRSYRAMNCDIMLIKLKDSLRYFDEVSPVCLPDTDDLFDSSTKCFLTGWGRLTFGGRKPKKLYQVALPVLNRETCARWYRDPDNWYDDRGKAFPVTKNMICAGYAEGGASGCHGDSGGPFVCQQGKTWVLAGVVSWGGVCGQRHVPTVMTDVTRFTAWVEKTMKRN